MPTLESDAQAAKWAPTLDAHCPALRRAAAESATFVAEMGQDSAPQRWLTFTGIPGCGKTMLARQIFEQGRRLNPGNRGIWMASWGPRPGCSWIDASTFAEEIKGGDYHQPERLKHDFLVVFDDLGTARDKSDFIADAIFRFCNARMNRWTVFTSNLLLDEISDRVDNRVASRLIRDRNRICRIEAEDYARVQLRRQKQLTA